MTGEVRGGGPEGCFNWCFSSDPHTIFILISKTTRTEIYSCTILEAGFLMFNLLKENVGLTAAPTLVGNC